VTGQIDVFGHVWPGDIDHDAACERCGLRYAEWDDEAGCTGGDAL
jgi:hypothetical protein